MNLAELTISDLPPPAAKRSPSTHSLFVNLITVGGRQYLCCGAV